MMNKIKGSEFNNARITLDNMNYEDCKFINCTIEFSGVGKTNLESCHFHSCQWVFVGPAEQTLAFLQLMYNEFGEFGHTMIEATFDQIRKPINITSPSHNEE